jgi:hypothetical protein
VVRWNKCLNQGGDYVEKLSEVLRTLHVFWFPCMYTIVAEKK